LVEVVLVRVVGFIVLERFSRFFDQNIYVVVSVVVCSSAEYVSEEDIEIETSVTVVVTAAVI
jgi:hypothetical protein